MSLITFPSDNDIVINGSLTVATSASLPASCITNANVSATAAIARSKLEQDNLKPFAIPITQFRVWNDMDSLPPSTSSADDLGLYDNTFGTGSPTLRTYDVKAAGAVTLYSRVMIPIPAEYVSGETVQIRIKAGMVTNVADTSATLDIEAYKTNEEGGIGSDLCATAAQSINSLTFANKDFTVTSSGLAAGDLLDVRVTIAVNDAATGTAVIAAIGSVKLLADVKG